MNKDNESVDALYTYLANTHIHTNIYPYAEVDKYVLKADR